MKLNQTYLKNAGYFFGVLVLFYIITRWFFAPAFDGMALKQGDMQQVRFMTDAPAKFKEINGQYPNWNDRLFSGMPNSLISGIPQGSVLAKYNPLVFFGAVKYEVSFLFLCMLSMYVLLLSVRVDKYLSIAGAIGYAFMTFTISSFEAGHITKVLAMSVMPGALAGVLLISQKRYLFGAAVYGLFFAMLVYYFHYQILYYAGIIIALYVVIEIVKTLKTKEWKHFAMILGITGVVSVLGVMTCVGKIYDTMEYSKATMRGGSEVASEVPQDGPKTVNAKGLDIEYAFSWSYGITESLTLFVPRFKGGSSDEPVPDNIFGQERLPMYYGDLQFTSGPIYMGAGLMFMFIFSIVFSFLWKKEQPDNIEAQNFAYVAWFGIGIFAVSLILSWGKYVGLNEWLFNNLPYYNKFRTPMMALSIAQVIVPFVGVLGVYNAITQNWGDTFAKKLQKTALYTLGGIVLVLMIVANGQQFKAPVDSQIGDPSAITEIHNLRKELLWNDLWRSVGIMAFIALLVWGALKKQLSMIVFAVLTTVVVAFDLIGVSGRYLNDENWEEKEVEQSITPTRLDEQIMATNKEGARVFDLRYNPFNDNHAAPFHKNVGGYHPAKLSRYQDLISYGITKNGAQMSADVILNNQVLDMLNCKYVLTKSQDGKNEEVIPRQTALGHAWFADSIVKAESAVEALKKLNTLNLGKYAVSESKDAAPSQIVYSYGEADNIARTSYSFDTLTYISSNTNKALAVFSEIYYNEKNGSWKVFVNGTEAKSLKLNYLLRAVELPAGKNDVKWVYVPTSRDTFLNLEMASSGLILLLFLGLMIRPLFAKEENA